MSLLSDKDRQHLTEELANLPQPVSLLVFTQEFECQYCRETRQIAEELAALSEHVSVEVYDFQEDETLAATYGIDKIPATIVMRGGDDPKDYGIRYYGIPSGYEFSSLVEDILMVATGESGLGEATRQWAAGLTEPLHLQVFVTPTCPYCPRAVLLAHQLAVESDLIRADMVEATEFPHLSMKYQVMGVPRTVINETVHMEGAAPEGLLLNKLQEALVG
ncbi:MAG: thioredoxin family protein [Candidatus Promineifilaceae bacterium]|nr:thioredoxin family protein [Candidatus Promineifilaceae bacterium]